MFYFIQNDRSKPPTVSDLINGGHISLCHSSFLLESKTLYGKYIQTFIFDFDPQTRSERRNSSWKKHLVKVVLYI